MNTSRTDERTLQVIRLIDAGMLTSKADRAELRHAKQVMDVYRRLQDFIRYEESPLKQKLTRELNKLVDDFYRTFYPEPPTSTPETRGRAA